MVIWHKVMVYLFDNCIMGIVTNVIHKLCYMVFVTMAQKPSLDTDFLSFWCTLTEKIVYSVTIFDGICMCTINNKKMNRHKHEEYNTYRSQLKYGQLQTARGSFRRYQYTPLFHTAEERFWHQVIF